MTKNRQALTRIWSSFIEPVLNFGSVLWNSKFQYVKDEIDKICNKFWRMMRVVKPKNCLMPSSVVLLRDLQLLHRIVNSKIPCIDPNDYFFKTNDVRTREFTEDHLFKKRFDHQKMKNTFFQRVVPVWNRIPRSTRDTSYFRFTKEIKKMLYNKQLSLD